jgi:dTDP-4-amino-4,6-dideoxygalactose transaminase
MTGSWGDIAAFSFYSTKNLGAIGDGGMVLTDNPLLAERVRMLRQYGWRERFISDISDGNSRMGEVQAAILSVKLRYLDKENLQRHILAETYDELLINAGLNLLQIRLGASHVYHQYVVRLTQRNAFQACLSQAGIGTLIHYPEPVHLQPAYRNRFLLVYSLSGTEQVAGDILSLPMYPQLRDDQVRRIGECIVCFHNEESIKNYCIIFCT